MKSKMLFLMVTFIASVSTEDIVLYPREEPLQEISGFEIPDSLLISMNDVQNVTEFIDNYIVHEGLTDDDIAGNVGVRNISDSAIVPSLDGRRQPGVAAGSTAPVANGAGCMPLKTSVELPKDKNDLTLFYWPICVHIERCSGCCSSPRLTCAPTKVSTVDVKVIKARYPRPGANKFNFEGHEIFTLEKHEKCTCRCSKLAEHCTPQQIYVQNSCSCVCPNAQEAQGCQHPLKFWDTADCLCKCKQMLLCSTGFAFSPETCRCEEM